MIDRISAALTRSNVALFLRIGITGEREQVSH